MASLSDIPFLSGYMQQGQLNRQNEFGELRQAAGVQSLMANMRAQRQAEQERAEMEKIKPLLAQAGGPENAGQMLIKTGNPKLIELGTKLLSTVPKPANRVMATVKTPKGPMQRLVSEDDPTGIDVGLAPDKTEKEVKIVQMMRAAGIQKGSEKWNKFLDNALRKESETAKQISPIFNMSQPVTPVTIQDPKDPSATIVIDGRTKKVLGKGPKMTQAGAIDAKAQLSMTGLGSDLQSAEDILTGVVRTSDGQIVKGNLPTGSGVGSLYDTAAGFFGASPSGAAEADALKTVSARLVGRVPRFEGPQSDKDVLMYKQAAGDAGNDKLPRSRRLAAIRTMRQIYAGYESGQRGRLLGANQQRRSTDTQRESGGAIGGGNILEQADAIIKGR